MACLFIFVVLDGTHRALKHSQITKMRNNNCSILGDKSRNNGKYKGVLRSAAKKMKHNKIIKGKMPHCIIKCIKSDVWVPFFRLFLDCMRKSLFFLLSAKLHSCSKHLKMSHFNLKEMIILPHSLTLTLFTFNTFCIYSQIFENYRIISQTSE